MQHKYYKENCFPPIMPEKPIPIAVGVIIHENKVLLIKRIKDPYAGYWSFPGGKIEFGEEVHNTAIREIEEETGVTSSFIEHYGMVSERVIETEKVTHHFLIHLCKLHPKTTEIKQGSEGEVAWINFEDVKAGKEKLVPSDTFMLEKMILTKQKAQFECLMEKKGNLYIVKKFE